MKLKGESKMEVRKCKYKVNYCNECHKKMDGDKFDIEIGIFVSAICPDCLNKFRKMINDIVEEGKI